MALTAGNIAHRSSFKYTARLRHSAHINVCSTRTNATRSTRHPWRAPRVSRLTHRGAFLCASLARVINGRTIHQRLDNLAKGVWLIAIENPRSGQMPFFNAQINAMSHSPKCPSNNTVKVRKQCNRSSMRRQSESRCANRGFEHNHSVHGAASTMLVT